MVLKRCHFDDLFKKTLSQIEEEFDTEFEDGFPVSLEGADGQEVRSTIYDAMGKILEQHWDKEFDEENHNKSLYQRLIYEHIIFLLYMLKDSKEEK